MKQKGLSRIDVPVLVSSGKKLKLRLIAEIIPESVYQKRIQKVNKANKQGGYTTSKDYKARARFNLFITNLQENKFTSDQILVLYRMRWQIELMFKNWKSICAIDKIQAMKYERFTCMMYTKLILNVLKIQLYWNFNNYFYITQRKILSTEKCFKTLQNSFHIIWNILKENKKVSELSASRIGHIFSKNHWKEKRKGRLNYEEIINLIHCNSNIYTYFKAKERGLRKTVESPNNNKKFIDMVKLQNSTPFTKQKGFKKEDCHISLKDCVLQTLA
jgi:hypothetical protein